MEVGICPNNVNVARRVQKGKGGIHFLIHLLGKGLVLIPCQKYLSNKLIRAEFLQRIPIFLHQKINGHHCTVRRLGRLTDKTFLQNLLHEYTGNYTNKKCRNNTDHQKSGEQFFIKFPVLLCLHGEGLLFPDIR